MRDAAASHRLCSCSSRALLQLRSLRLQCSSFVAGTGGGGGGVALVFVQLLLQVSQSKCVLGVAMLLLLLMLLLMQMKLLHGARNIMQPLPLAGVPAVCGH